MLEKIKTLREIKEICRNLKKEGKRIITTNGCFDLLHMGHVDSLQRARSLGEVLIVGLNSDNSVKKFKGDKRPINDEKSRAGVLAALGCVDYVVLFGEKDPRRLLSVIKPNKHVKGGDRKISEIIEKDVVEKYGGEVILLPVIEGYSTTGLIGKILNVYH